MWHKKVFYLLVVTLLTLMTNRELEGRSRKSDCAECKVSLGDQKEVAKVKVVNSSKKSKRVDCKACNKFVSPKAKPKAQMPSAKREPVAQQKPALVPEKVVPKPEKPEKVKEEKPVAPKGEPVQPIEIKGGRLVEIESKKEFEQYKSADIPVVIEVYAPWCGPCKTMKPKLEKLAKEMPSIVIAKLNGDKLRSITNEYKITGFPHFLFFKDGKLAGRTSGGMEIDLMRSYIRKFLGEKKPTPAPKVEDSKKAEEKPDTLEDKPKPAEEEKKLGEPGSGELIELKSFEEFKQYRAADKKVLIEVYASWCGPCKGMVPKLQKLAKEMPDITFAKIDGHKLSTVSKEYNISGYPTFLFFENGKQKGRTSGGMEIDLMRSYIRKFFGEKKA